MIENFIEKTVSAIPFIGIEEVMTTLLAMTPIVGIRGAIPLALFVYEMDIYSAYFWSVFGEFFPVFFILLFLGKISEWLSKNFSFMKKFFDFLFSKTRKNYNGRIEKYGLFALFLYTGIPLPFSGAWTASLVTFLFGFPRKKAIIAIFLGVMLSGINILLILKTGIAIEKYSGQMMIIGLAMLASLLYFLYHRRNNKKNV
jgi:uncharacterized membrane protein